MKHLTIKLPIRFLPSGYETRMILDGFDGLGAMDTVSKPWWSKDDPDARENPPRKIVDEMKRDFMDAVRDNARVASNADRHGHLFCAEGGTVLHVRHGNMAWGYSIVQPGRDGFTGTWGFDTFDEAVDVAREHARQSWGGVTGECGT